MRCASDEILSFVKVLVKHPESVRVTQSNSSPPVFEITVHQDDLEDIRSKEVAVRAICPESKKVLLKFIEG
jgi:predicted RNA-binding protein YlqC (UPF0109 family)